MKLFKIAFRIFKENKDLNLAGKIYLTHTYIANIISIKRNYSSHFHLNKFNEFKNNKEKNLKIENNGIDFKKEIRDIKYAIFLKRVNKLKEKIYSLIQIFNLKYLFDLKNSQNNLDKFFDFMSRHIATYKKSIQELVEGQREVTQSKTFRFEDGETVEEKMENFDKKVKEILHLKNSPKDNIEK
jgi:hypothetical protein